MSRVLFVKIDFLASSFFFVQPFS